MSKFIITAALTGAIHTPTMSPYLPITPDEIAADAQRASEAGAAVVHVHARDPETGQPSADSALLMGGFTRVGLEDNLYLEKGVMAKSSGEQVEKIVRIAREHGMEPATPDEAREILGLKGIENVKF